MKNIAFHRGPEAGWHQAEVYVTDPDGDECRPEIRLTFNIVRSEDDRTQWKIELASLWCGMPVKEHAMNVAQAVLDGYTGSEGPHASLSIAKAYLRGARRIWQQTHPLQIN